MEDFLASRSTSERRLFYSLIWSLLLIFIVWPLAMFIAPIWIFLIPFEVVFGPLIEVNAFLEKLLTWPRQIGRAVLESDQKFPNPFA